LVNCAKTGRNRVKLVDLAGKIQGGLLAECRFYYSTPDFVKNVKIREYSALSIEELIEESLVVGIPE